VNYDWTVRDVAVLRALAVLGGLGVTSMPACGSSAARPPTTIENVTGPAPPPRVTCYAGRHVGIDGVRATIFMRRTLDRGASTIRQESVLASNGYGFATDWVADFTVAGETFISSTSGLSHGDGRLEGPPWAWTHWTEQRRSRGYTGDEMVEQVDGWLAGVHLRFAGHVMPSDRRWTSELDAIDCGDYQPRIDALEANEKEIAPP